MSRRRRQARRWSWAGTSAGPPDGRRPPRRRPWRRPGSVAVHEGDSRQRLSHLVALIVAAGHAHQVLFLPLTVVTKSSRPPIPPVNALLVAPARLPIDPQ